MNLFIFLLEKRRASLHIFFCTVYLLFFFVLNWRSDGTILMQALTLMLIGSVGIGIAYIMRYVLILAIKRGQWARSLLLLFANFSLIAIVGYIIFHGFQNPLSEEIVNPAIKHPWQSYIRFYIGWYTVAAKYGILFFLGESALFWTLDNLLSRYWPDHVPPREKHGYISPHNQGKHRRNQLAGHFLNNLMNRVYSRLMSGKRMKRKQVANLVSLVDYGQLNYHRSSQAGTSLKDEIAAVRHLLAMEEAHGIRLRVQGNIEQVEIPAMLLPSIAKNMVKHGAITENDKALLSIRMEGATLYVTSDNRLGGESRWQQTDGGYGLKHIRQILNDVFGSRATLRTGIVDGRFSLYLQIDDLKGWDDE